MFLPKEAVLAADLLDLPHCHNPRAPSFTVRHRPRPTKRAGRRRSRVGAGFPQTAGFSSEFPQIPGGDFHPRFALVASLHPRHFGHVRWEVRGCRFSSPESRAMSAPPSSRACARRRPRRARLRRSAARITAPVDELVEGDAIAGTGLDRALDGVEVAYYLIHSMEGRPAALRRARAPGGRALRRRGRGAPACGGSSTSAGSCRSDGAALAPPRLAARGRGAAAGGGAGVDRAARLDRDRRALALVPLPRAAGRAACRCWRCRLARTTARGRSTGATCSTPARAPRPRRRALAGRSWDIAGPDVMSYEELDRADRRRHARPPPAARHRLHDDGGRVASWPRRSPARTSD